MTNKMDISSLFHRLRDTAEEKRVRLQQIYELTVEQSEALQSNQLKVFVDLSNRKQSIIEEINSIDERFERVYDVVKQYSNTGTFNEVYIKQKDLLEVQHTISLIQDLTEKIRNRELENDFLYKKIISKIMSSAPQDFSSRQEQIARYKRISNYKKNSPK